MINDSLMIVQMLLLFLLLVLALAAVHTHALRHAVIYLGVYSLISSLIYLLYGAADVAITEAIIGCTLSTILFLVALKKYQIFVLYYKTDSLNGSVPYLRRQIEQQIRRFAYEVLDFQMEITLTELPPEVILSDHDFDIFIHHTNEEILCYGLKDNYHFADLKKYLEQSFPEEPLRFLEVKERSQDVS